MVEWATRSCTRTTRTFKYLSIFPERRYILMNTWCSFRLHDIYSSWILMHLQEHNVQTIRPTLSEFHLERENNCSNDAISFYEKQHFSIFWYMHAFKAPEMRFPDILHYCINTRQWTTSLRQWTPKEQSFTFRTLTIWIFFQAEQTKLQLSEHQRKSTANGFTQAQDRWF